MKQATTLSILIIALAALLTGCGGGSSTDSATATNASASAEFLKPGGRNKIAAFGREASSEEREAASRVLETSLEARAKADFAEQCKTLAAATRKEIEKSATIEGHEGDCAKELEGEAEPLPETKTIRANTMTGPIDVLRVKGDKAFALYHGTKGINYAIPLKRENGSWKVASLITRELP